MMINTNATEPSAKADFTVGGISGRSRILSMLEWKYIFNGKNDRSRTASVCGITGKVVAPDDFSGTLADSYDSAKWAVAESQGVLFDCQYTFFNFMETLRCEGCAIRLVENVTE